MLSLTFGPGFPGSPCGPGNPIGPESPYKRDIQNRKNYIKV